MDNLTKNAAQSGIINSVLFGSESESNKILRIIKPDHLSGNARKVYSEILKLDCKSNERFVELSQKLAAKPELLDYVYNCDNDSHTTVLGGQIEFLLEIHNQKNLTAHLRNITASKDSSGDKARQLLKLSHEYNKQKSDAIVVDSKEIYFNILDDLEFDGDQKGWSWGLSLLDRLTGGIENEKTYVIGALKKTGKTRFMVDIIHSLFEQKKKCMIFSLEMSARALQQFILCRFAKVTTNVFKLKLADSKALKLKISETLPILANNVDMIKIIDEPGLTVNEVIEKIKRVRSLGIDVVFLDYLQRLSLPDENRAYGLQEVVAKLADCAREENLSIIFLSQLANRAENRIATIADLKESGGIGENVDCALIMNNMDRIQGIYEQEKKTNSILTIIEQRSGESGSVKMQAKLATCEFYLEKL